LISTAAGGVRDEGERAILVDRDLDRRDAAVLLCGLGVERLAELHDVDAVLTERSRPAAQGSCPPGICNLIVVRIFFAITSYLSPA
jgi:hypothetical protein